MSCGWPVHIAVLKSKLRGTPLAGPVLGRSLPGGPAVCSAGRVLPWTPPEWAAAVPARVLLSAPPALPPAVPGVVLPRAPVRLATPARWLAAVLGRPLPWAPSPLRGRFPGKVLPGVPPTQTLPGKVLAWAPPVAAAPGRVPTWAPLASLPVSRTDPEIEACDSPCLLPLIQESNGRFQRNLPTIIVSGGEGHIILLESLHQKNSISPY